MGVKLPQWACDGIRWCVRTVYPKLQIYGMENLPEEPVILVGNHCKVHGPVFSQIYAPGNAYAWCAGEMMHFREVPAYAYQDFWSHKPKLSRPLYKLLSYLIAPASVIFSNARTIGVYRDARILSTFKTTVQRLQEGSNIVIFPEHDADYNPILCDFQDKFIDVAKLYYRRTGQRVSFVPMYLAPRLKAVYIGKPIVFYPETPMEQERKRICTELMEAITEMAVQLPEHKIIPYRNLPRRKHPSNKEILYEKTDY